MQTQPRLFGIVLLSTVFSLLCWGAICAQQAPPSDPPPDPSSGVRLIDTTPDAPAENGANSAVRTASGAKSDGPTSTPAQPSGTDAGLRPVDPSMSVLRPAATDQGPAGADQAPQDNGNTEKDKPAVADKGANASPDKIADKGADKDADKGGDPAKAKAKLEPIPDPQQLGPVELEATSLHGVTPGRSTKPEMEKAWGAAKEIHKQDKTLVYLYTVGPFQRVEVSCSGDKVSSIIVRFDKAFPAQIVAKQLGLTNVQPVLVCDELGEILGQSYPERGVLFSFAPSDTPGKPSMKVSHIILEPISAESFVLRAETNLDARPDFSLHDLDQALQLKAANGRAHWLRCRVLASFGEYEKALADGAEAIRLEPGEPHYRLTRAEVLARSWALKEAAAEAQKAVELGSERAHVKARALCLLGDISASGMKPDYRQAMEYHGEAVKLAEPLTTSKHPAVRVAAKEVMLEAYLGAAHDIAWGNWREKDKAVTVWLDKASAFADDLVKSEAGSQECRFRVANRALAVCVGLRGQLDPAPWIGQSLDSGRELIAATTEPVYKSHLQWDLGMALYDGMQVCQARDQRDEALRWGEMAADHLEKGCPLPLSRDNAYLLGRLYYRLGAIHAVGDKNHRLAVGWFDKALPLLEKTPTDRIVDQGRHGESLVSMGVSYWETGQQKKAVDLTEHGLKLMEQSAQQGQLAKTTLSVPYSNLAWMHRKLGEAEQAAYFEQMAAKSKLSELR